MRTFGAELAFKAIQSHMSSRPFDFQNQTNYKIGMYSSRKDILFGEELEDIEFDKKTYVKNDNLYVIDQSAQHHLGVKYIVLENHDIFEQIIILKYKVIGYTLFTMFFISIIGYFLSRLFLKPIASEREKLDRFIKDTTHELNTPISALLMSTSALSESDKKVKDRIKLSATRISNIYDDLCYLLKNDINATNEIKEINIKNIIAEQLLLLETYTKSKKIEIQINHLDDLIYKIDEESIKRLITNILSNALKYSRPNSKVEISIKENTLLVKDYGEGIEEKNLKKIKTRYFRANTSEGGFGIGLDIVNSVCLKYGIEFGIESVKDEGTSISLKF